MVERQTTTLRVREAVEEDASAIIDVFRSGYGEDYMYPQFYEETGIRRMILTDGTLVLVAEDASSGKVVGTASVILEVGAFSDLIGEFGRLVVVPEARGCGIGQALMAARVERVRDRLHVGLVEARTVHPYSCQIAAKNGFAPVGILPNALGFGLGREHAGVYVQHFGDALALRRNHPRIIPEAYELAGIAMSQVGLEPDVVVDDEAAAYPHGGDFEIETLRADGYSSLLRIERGRVRRREVYGPLKLHYGFFKLAATHAHYLIARDGPVIVGAVGFIQDERERHVRVFELIQIEETAVRALLVELCRRAREWGARSIEIDVDADAPRMQRTLLELDLWPACYLPAHCFQDVERRDIVKMWRLLEPPAPRPEVLPDPAPEVMGLVLDAFEQQQIREGIQAVLESGRLFATLTDEQALRLGRIFGLRRFIDGQRLFERGSPSEDMYVVTDGHVSIERRHGTLATIGPGGSVGEVAMLAGTRHSATAVAEGSVETGRVSRTELQRLVRQRPDIGVVLYRNIARELGDKLRSME